MERAQHPHNDLLSPSCGSYLLASSLGSAEKKWEKWGKSEAINRFHHFICLAQRRLHPLDPHTFHMLRRDNSLKQHPSHRQRTRAHQCFQNRGLHVLTTKSGGGDCNKGFACTLICRKQGHSRKVLLHTVPTWCKSCGKQAPKPDALNPKLWQTRF